MKIMSAALFVDEKSGSCPVTGSVISLTPPLTLGISGSFAGYLIHNWFFWCLILLPLKGLFFQGGTDGHQLVPLLVLPVSLVM
jgi:hypothetical protein